MSGRQGGWQICPNRAAFCFLLLLSWGIAESRKARGDVSRSEQTRSTVGLSSDSPHFDDAATNATADGDASWEYTGTQRPTPNIAALSKPTPPPSAGQELESEPKEQSERWKIVPGFVRQLYQSIADDRGFIRNPDSELVQNATAVWTFTNKLKGRARSRSNKLSFSTRTLFQPKKPTHALPKIQRAYLRLYRKPLEGVGTAGSRARRREGGADRLRVTINYHTSRSAPAIPIRQAVTELNKHGWETLDVTDLLLILQRSGARRRRLSLSIGVDVISVPSRQPFANRSRSEIRARPLSPGQVFTLGNDSPSSVPLLTVYLLNETGKVEDLMPRLVPSRRQRRSAGAGLCDEDRDNFHDANKAQHPHQGYCHLQDMKVAFAADLQWTEILTPRSIHAMDCVGTCEIPIGKVKNNAVLRHWYWQYPHAGNGSSPLSCTPTRFASVTMLSHVEGVFELLYFPDMVAVECGCA